MKVCGKCKVNKSVYDFYKNKSRKSGIASSCKVCDNKNHFDYYHKNPEMIKERCSIYYHKNAKKISDYGINYRINNSEKMKERDANRYINNTESIKKNNLKYRNNNKEKIYKQLKMVREGLPDHYVKSRLRQHGYPQELINNPEFIEVKRLIIKTQRLCRTSRN